MSDPRDPMDDAYVQSEALLDDDDVDRAARRARVLAAVAREPAAPPARLSIWRRGGWLAAAGVVGVSVLLASQIYRPIPHPQPAAPPPVATLAPAAPETSSAPAPTPPAPTPQAAHPAPPISTPAPAPTRRDEAVAAPPPPQDNKPMARAAAPVASDAAPAPPPPPPPAAPVFAPAPMMESKASALPASDEARLRAAAAAGRTAEVQALLAQGVPVDAPDAQGDTALMQSIRADHPAAAALLRRHGASLERTNHAGQSARDLALAKPDAEIDEALGLKH